MTLVIEDGTGKADAQSYADAVTLKAYALARGVTVPSTAKDCEILLLKAMDCMLEGSDYLRGATYIGYRSTKHQALDWPRYDVIVQGWPYPATELPRQLEQAQCALAIELQTVDLLPTIQANSSGAITQEVVGPISVSYANAGTVSQVPASAKADTLLRLLLKRNGLMAIRA